MDDLRIETWVQRQERLLLDFRAQTERDMARVGTVQYTDEEWEEQFQIFKRQQKRKPPENLAPDNPDVIGER